MIVEIFFDCRASLASSVGRVQNRDLSAIAQIGLGPFHIQAGESFSPLYGSGIFRGIEFGTRRLIQRPINPAQISVIEYSSGDAILPEGIPQARGQCGFSPGWQSHQNNV